MTDAVKKTRRSCPMDSNTIDVAASGICFCLRVLDIAPDMSKLSIKLRLASLKGMTISGIMFGIADKADVDIVDMEGFVLIDDDDCVYES